MTLRQRLKCDIKWCKKCCQKFISKCCQHVEFVKVLSLLFLFHFAYHPRESLFHLSMIRWTNEWMIKWMNEWLDGRMHDFRIGSSKVCLRRQKIMIFRIGSSKVGLRRQKNQDFLIFRSLLNAFWHADLRELVESFQNHQSDLKKVQSTSSYGQNIPKK